MTGTFVSENRFNKVMILNCIIALLQKNFIVIRVSDEEGDLLSSVVSAGSRVIQVIAAGRNLLQAGSGFQF